MILVSETVSRGTLERVGAVAHALVRVCSWCGTYLGVRPTTSVGGGVSDGICPSCSRRYFEAPSS